MNERFILTGFSDEIDESIKVQFEHLNTLGIKYFEPRGVNGKNISELTDAEIAALKEDMDSFGIKVSSIGSPIGKIKITDDFEPHLEKLRHTIKTAKALGTEYIRIFSFYVEENCYAEFRDEVIRRMRIMTEIAEDEGIVLLHENEKGIYGDNAARCLDIVTEINSPNLRCVFDPANFVQCGQKVYPEAFEMLRPYIEYMHIKDALEDGSVVPAGCGIGGVEQILKALNDSGWSGFLSLEPHLGSFTGFEALEGDSKTPVKEHSSAEKFDMAHDALKEILERIERT